MSRKNKEKIKKVEEVFMPNNKGISRWVTREECNKHFELKLGNNGNIRHNIAFNVRKYKWEIDRGTKKNGEKNQNGKILRLRTIGFSENKEQKSRPIRPDIKIELLEKYKNCLHCGIKKNLVIDHKNDMYNNPAVLNKETQTKDDFQVLCNKCNKDLKHQVNVKEIKSGKLHKVKDLGYPEFTNDNCYYPWEIGLTKYDKNNINCKNNTYWYDTIEFRRKKDIYSKYIMGLNNEIKNKIKTKS